MTAPIPHPQQQQNNQKQKHSYNYNAMGTVSCIVLHFYYCQMNET